MTNENLAKVTLYLHATWASYRPDEANAFALRRNLADLPFDAVLASVDQLATEHPQFAPNPQTIRARAVEMLHGTDTSKGDAWGELLREIGRVGYVGDPEFSDLRIRRVVEQLGGWAHICQTWMVDDEMANRAHFFRLWDELASQGRHAAMTEIESSDQKALT